MATPAATGSAGRRTANMLEANTHLWRQLEAIETGAWGVARVLFTVLESIDAAINTHHCPQARTQPQKSRM